MSVFSICTWWSTQCADYSENYDSASLLCTRFGLEDNEKDYIVVGCQSGQLSVFYAALDYERLAASDSRNAFKPTDLLLEIQLGFPILGIYAGRFSGNPRHENMTQLAVLHPQSVTVYNVESMGGITEHGSQLFLTQLADYKFRRTAFGFCKGHFGKVKGRDFFCIVHLDGTLTFYEQDGITYECQFPGHRALPSPVVYCERIDSFVRFSATWHLECYTYQDLSHSSINKSVYQPIWSVCLGEGIIDMSCVQIKEDNAAIVILGERNFICLNDNGQVNSILKLDYAPKCFHPFVIGYYWEPNARLLTAIVSESGKLHIYEDANIIWAAQGKSEAPVAIQRSNITGLPGAIVSLGPTGQLNIGYLGSDPYQFKVPLPSGEEISFAKAHKELVQLEEEIRASVDVQDGVAINRKAHDDVRVQFEIGSEVTMDSDALLLDVLADVAVRELPAGTGHLTVRSKVDLHELQVVINTPLGVRCSLDTQSFTDVSAGMTEQWDLDFYIAELLHIPSARVEVVVSFISPRGIPRVIEQVAYLPLTMFYKAKQPQKATSMKLTYTITSATLQPKLGKFFPEFLTWESEAQALGLLLLCPGGGENNEEVVTIVAAKNSNRFRIQTDNLETLPMILERLQHTVFEHELNSSTHSEGSAKDKKKSLLNPNVNHIMANPSIPSQEILHRVDVHRETQENIRTQTAALDELWLQFKELQRKLQEKPEDEPKEALVLQIEENYDRLIAEGDKLMDMRKEERRQSATLTCAISVAAAIVACLKIEEKVMRVILSVLVTPTEDWTELSWEESMSPGVDMLYHYGPLTKAKTANGNADANIAATTFEQFDYSRFRRHMATLFERICRLANTDETAALLPPPVASEPPTTLASLNAADAAMSLPKLPGAGGKKLLTAQRPTLEAVEDDDEEEPEEDENDLRKMGYRKDYGHQVQRDKAEEQKKKKPPKNGNADETDLNSEWVNEQYELPSSEELFSDLGIWW